MAEIKPAEVSEVLKKQLLGFKTEIELEEVGTVLQVGDGIARVYGLNNVRSGELVEFDNGVKAIALNLEEDNVGVVLMGDSSEIKEGDKVKVKLIGTDPKSGKFKLSRKALIPKPETKPREESQ